LDIRFFANLTLRWQPQKHSAMPGTYRVMDTRPPQVASELMDGPSIDAEANTAANLAGIEKLRRVPLREVWKHEALDFTTWLERNPDVLGDVVELSLENIEREKSAGAFSVDLVAEDAGGDTIIIENQLERSDHDHLGKLVTYLSALEAKAAIWIVSDPRPEHVGAITWLNESVAASFYLVKLEAIRIGESPAAPLLTLITGPSAETRQVGAQKQERAERHDLRELFWASLLDRARERTRLHSSISPSSDGWITAGAGRSGVHYAYVVLQRGARVELVMEGSDLAENHRIFEELLADREAIERAFGGPLDWDRREGRKKCFVGVTFRSGGYQDDRDTWAGIQDEMIDGMVRLEAALKDRIPRLDAT
jgi:hypothetical protein